MFGVVLLTVIAVWALGSVPIALSVGWAIRRYPPATSEIPGRPGACEPLLNPAAR